MTGDDRAASVPPAGAFVAIAGALVLFLGVAFMAFSAGGGSTTTAFGPCDAGLHSPGLTGRAGTGITDLNDEQRRNAATIVGVARDMGARPRGRGSSHWPRRCRSRPC